MAPAVTVESPEMSDFRERARRWLAEHVPRRPTGGNPGNDLQTDLPHYSTLDHGEVIKQAKEFQGQLFDACFAGITWPQHYGGQGLTIAHQIAFDEEAASFELPTGTTFAVTHGMCGPTLLACGTEQQKLRYIRPMLRGEEIWCQLFSEPGAGSDVAGLQSRAVRDGDEWVVTGQKVWTSGAHHARFGLVIARTDPDRPKHQGITMFVVDMGASGVAIRPLRQMTGGSHFNEVFFDQVRVPDGNVVGDVNGGWRASITTLMNERVSIGAGGRKMVFGSLLTLADRQGETSDPVVRQRLADLYMRERVLGFIGQRIRAAVVAGGVPGPQGSIAKIAGAQLNKQAGNLGIDLLGCRGIAWAPGDSLAMALVERLLASPGSSIAGGTDEIQKNIVAERVLGLPKEPQVDRDIPFRDVLSSQLR